MCPAPAPLHLERYIGSCLISAGLPHQLSHHHQLHHNHHPPHNNNNNNYQKKESQQQTRYRRYPHPPPPCHQTGSEFCGPANSVGGNGGPYPRTWTTAAGLPLISLSPASPRRGVIKDNKHQQDDRSPLSRLAIHTQGAPLIQAGRQQPRLPKQNNKQQKKEKDQKDFSSVASDESSGNSENSLPRIIKPRKRRKKDRKPQQTPGSATQTVQATTETALQETAIVTLKPYTPLCQDFEPQKNGNNHIDITPNDKEITTIRSNKILSTEYQIIEENNITIPASAPLCQCRYCDPINLTWDVDQRCYSPFLTPPNSVGSSFGSSSSQDWSFDPRGSSLEVSSEIITSPNGHRDIEIKFFSTSPPASKITPPARPISVTPPWPN